jgi:L-lactate dehydrogenase complex protein LldG
VEENEPERRHAVTTGSREEILHRIRKGLGRGEGAGHADSEAPLPRNSGPSSGAREQLSKDDLADVFAQSLTGVNTSVYRENETDGIREFIAGFVSERGLESFSIWETEFLNSLGIKESLEGSGLAIKSAENKAEIALSSVGITEADYAIADTGTLVLLSGPERPRGVSLIPPVHLAIVKKENIVSNIEELFGIVNKFYEDHKTTPASATFITGPSRTADIELNLTLGVHGPKELHVLIVC